MSYVNPHFIDKITKQPVFFSDIQHWSIVSVDNMSLGNLLLILLVAVLSGGIGLLLLFCFRDTLIVSLNFNDGTHQKYTIDDKTLKLFISSNEWHSSASILEAQQTEQ